MKDLQSLSISEDQNSVIHNFLCTILIINAIQDMLWRKCEDNVHVLARGNLFNCK